MADLKLRIDTSVPRRAIDALVELLAKEPVARQEASTESDGTLIGPGGWRCVYCDGRDASRRDLSVFSAMTPSRPRRVDHDAGCAWERARVLMGGV